MNGAIFYSGRYGSTEQYSQWIGEATGLPMHSIDDPAADPEAYDFLVLGSSIVFFRTTIRDWVNGHMCVLASKPVILFTVSGAGASAKLDRWVAKSLPADFVSGVDHVALRGRLNHDEVSWWLKILLKIGSLFNRDSEAARDERYGFDYMDRSSIRPVVALVERYKAGAATSGAGR